MRRALPLLLILALAGCKGSREKEVVGTWSLQGGSVNIAEGKTYTATIGPMTETGVWSMDGSTITMQGKQLNGRPIDELKANLQKNAALIPPQAKAFVENLGKPNVLTLGEDGKTLTTDKSKDTNTGPAMTLTKQG